MLKLLAYISKHIVVIYVGVITYQLILFKHSLILSIHKILVNF